MTVQCYVDSDGWLWPKPGCPFDIVHDPIPEATAQDYIRPWNVILHSNAGPRYTHGSDLQDYMAREDINIECHANVETLPNGRGLFRQIMPFGRRADCNADANSWYVGGQRVGAISFETQDNGSSTLHATPWTAGQQEAITQAIAAINVRYGIPIKECSAWNMPGVDYHSKFSQWSVYVGKTCPGATRIASMPTIRENSQRLLNETVVPVPPVVPEEDEEDMYIVWRHPSWANHFLVGGGGVVHVTPETLKVYRFNGVPIIVEAHEQMLDSCLASCGLDRSALIPV